MADFRAIVVGAGGISGWWFPTLLAEQVEIPAVVDLNLSAAQARIEEFSLSAEASADLGAMLKKHQPDFVVDLTVPEAHCAVTCQALKAGCHVIGEKPMAASMAEARRMVRTAEETGKLYMVSQSRRWDPKTELVSRIVTAGKLGTLGLFNCDFYIGAHFTGFRNEMPSVLLLDMAIHHLDLARYMSGTDPVAVYAQEFNPPGSWTKGDAAASCIFEMTNGVIFTYRGSWVAEGCQTSWNGDWHFVGDRGSLVYEHDQTPQGELATGAVNFVRRLKPLPIPAERLKHLGPHGALSELLKYLRGGKVPQTEGHDNIKSLAMVFAAIQSSKQKKRVPVRAL